VLLAGMPHACRTPPAAPCSGGFQSIAQLRNYTTPMADFTFHKLWVLALTGAGSNVHNQALQLLHHLRLAQGCVEVCMPCLGNFLGRMCRRKQAKPAFVAHIRQSRLTQRGQLRVIAAARGRCHSQWHQLFAVDISAYSPSGGELGTTTMVIL